jgi:hypothetical protein
MGLDLYHRKVTPVGYDGTMTVAQDEAEPDPLVCFLGSALDEENTYIDWEKTFTLKGYPADAYRMYLQSADGSGVSYHFSRNDDADPALPEKLAFVENKNQHDLCLFKQIDKAIPYVEVGYQRKSVSGQFYEEFNGWEVITDKARVERIYQLTEDFAQANFKKTFLDNWEDGVSFVVIWY